MNRIPSFVRRGAAALLIAAGAATVPAGAITIATGSYTNSGIGSEFASAYDNFVVTGSTITIAPADAPVVVSLGDFSFEVGPNCYSCTLTPSFDALIDINVDGVTHQLDLPYNWYSSGPSDFLSFATPAPLQFDLGNLGVLTIALASPGLLSSSGATVYGQLVADVSLAPVPEPSSLALMVAGFGAIVFVVRRRRA